MVKDVKTCLKNIGGLSKTSKMPGYSYSLPASACKTGSKLRLTKGSVCEKCYAMKGCYMFSNVQAALTKRLWLINTPSFVEDFIVVLLSKYKNMRRVEDRFRWHDSGDLQGLEHLKKINKIALGTPNLKHWLPTKEIGIVNQYLKEGNTFADNLTVRISAPLIGESFKKRPLGLPFSTVDVTNKTVKQCPAYEQDGKCGDCSLCWDKTVNVNYPLH